MSVFEKVTNEALALPSKVEAELAMLLIQSLDENEDVKSAWLAEIRCRDEEIRFGLVVTRSAEQVLKETLIYRDYRRELKHEHFT